MAPRSNSISSMQLLASGVGVILVAVLDAAGVIDATGPGVGGAIRAALFYGLGGVGGGLVVYEVISRWRR